MVTRAVQQNPSVVVREVAEQQNIILEWLKRLQNSW
jgi:hypothetical protein